MFPKLFLLLLTAHMLGDYYLQSPRTAEKKRTRYPALLLHCLLYALPFALLLFLLPLQPHAYLLCAAAALLHWLIDSLKFLWERSASKKVPPAQAFLIDQGLHLICLLMLAYLMAVQGLSLRLPAAMASVFLVTGMVPYSLFKWGCILLCIGKPSNIFIRQSVALCRGKGTAESTDKGLRAGRYIGTIERLIILIFLAIEQYSAIGLVLTAKSIARYEKISKSQDFAEYYLLGTLLSTLCVILFSLIQHL